MAARTLLIEAHRTDPHLGPLRLRVVAPKFYLFPINRMDVQHTVGSFLLADRQYVGAPGMYAGLKDDQFNVESYFLDSLEEVKTLKAPDGQAFQLTSRPVKEAVFSAPEFTDVWFRLRVVEPEAVPWGDPAEVPPAGDLRLSDLPRLLDLPQGAILRLLEAPDIDPAILDALSPFGWAPMLQKLALNPQLSREQVVRLSSIYPSLIARNPQTALLVL
ncbi:MAG: hypothetical protein IT477_11005, partial [Rhodanobacteraceae bacterium]|nr:hypothetical protein [Rhodanobacteraceae bacterium]